MEQQKRSDAEVTELAGRAKAFADGIADLATEHAIPPDIALSVFGMTARQVVTYMVQKKGMTKAEAIHGVLELFTAGLGVKAVAMAELPPELEEAAKQACDAPAGPVH